MMQAPIQDDQAADGPAPHPDVFDQIMVHLVFAFAASLTVLVALCALAYLVSKLTQ